MIHWYWFCNTCDTNELKTPSTPTPANLAMSNNAPSMQNQSMSKCTTLTTTSSLFANAKVFGQISPLCAQGIHITLQHHNAQHHAWAGRKGRLRVYCGSSYLAKWFAEFHQQL